MREFVVRARQAPVDPAAFLASVGKEPHVEYLAQMFMDGMFVSKGHREDTVLTFTLERSPDYSRSLCIDGRTLGSLGGLTERALLETFADALKLGSGLGKEETIVTDSGIAVSTVSFERLVKDKAQTRPVYVLDKKGTDIREAVIDDDPVFVMTDHIPMPRKTFKSLRRQGVEGVSLGPAMLRTSQCLVLIHNELDRRGPF
ncbi:MAG: hypothetical protein WD356_06500 [Pseudomonadales bacterium]